MTTAAPRPVPATRLVLLAGAGAGLLAGSSTGLARVGFTGFAGPAAAHGIVMVLGFLGTLIALERAVALRAGWAYLGPALSATATFGLVLGLPHSLAGMLLVAAGTVVVVVYTATLRRHLEAHLLVMGAGAVLWVVAATAWTAGRSPIRLAPLLAGFLVLTIVGERLELSRLRVPDAATRRPLLIAASVFLVGTVTTLVDQRAGLVVAGLGLLGQTAWLARYDLARVTIRRSGLPRFAAACMLAGYAWLAAGGLLWIALGLDVGGPLIRDAALHAVFLGFVISMVMGHAPIILPAVLGTPLPYRRGAWLPLVLLHASLTVRVAGDLAGSQALREWSAAGNVAAVLLFVLVSATTAIVARRPRRQPARRPGRQAAQAVATAHDAHASGHVELATAGAGTPPPAATSVPPTEGDGHT